MVSDAEPPFSALGLLSIWPAPLPAPVLAIDSPSIRGQQDLPLSRALQMFICGTFVRHSPQRCKTSAQVT